MKESGSTMHWFFPVRQPYGLAFLNYRRPLDVPVLIPNSKDVSHLFSPFSSFLNS